ncbi:alpha/beta hydrolase family protein [Paenibacillus phocaensis]|uniref:alpha/beta hydrolase family protein n=1 Tax=Paenibacillus phocaensis TaxID=1776378 RepID=UPI000839B1F5|nr:alpha/beta hydrolase [Paenibacillus phocaensis]
MDLQVITELALHKPTLRQRMARRIRNAYRYDTAFWRSAVAGPWGAGMFAFGLLALGMPTGLGSPVDLLLFLLAGTLCLYLTAHAAALVLALIGVPIPRLFTGAVLFDFAAVFVIFNYNEVSIPAAAVIAAGISLAGVAAGLLAGALASRRLRLRHKAAAALTAALLVAAAAIWPFAAGNDSAVPAYQGAQSAGVETAGGVDEGGGLALGGDAEEALAAAVPSLADQLDSPAEPGPYAVSTFTYGSGNDAWQPEYGEAVDVKSESVDASAYIKKWSVYRTAYWGFNQRALPLNGRVWMPAMAEGESTGDSQNPFPLVLIVHGNHLMEDFSDDGYAYLGELLASRGFITVSIDENFLNYSVWTGIPDNDMKVRAWILLKHLQQLGAFADEPGNPLYGKIDLARIGLVGHSRGGQAVAMAAAYKDWFGSDAELIQSLSAFRIEAIAAIAPTDKKVDGKVTHLKDVSYLTLQGARDGDVSDFDGDRQYMRTSYSPGQGRFKASLYIEDANHSQFNSSWGGRDVSYPKGILLSRDGMLSPAEQRSIAKVYLSAFFEETLRSRRFGGGAVPVFASSASAASSAVSSPSAAASDAPSTTGEASVTTSAPGRYLPLLQDYRTGLAWLPDTAYYNRFESSAFTAWARYDEDSDRVTLPGGGKAAASGLAWKEEDARNRQNGVKPSRGIVLERRLNGGEPSAYGLSWEQGAPLPNSGQPEGLAFSLTDRSYELEDGVTPDAALASGSVAMDIELIDGNGISVRVPLERFRDAEPLPVTSFTIHPWLDRHLSGGKYKHPTEAVFQTYRLSLADFAAANPDFDPNTGIRGLAFRLSGGSAKLMLDDIGVY